MRVERNGLSRIDLRIQDAYKFILQQHRVMFGSGDQCVQFIGPFLSIGHHRTGTLAFSGLEVGTSLGPAQD